LRSPIDDLGGEILGHPIQFDGQDGGCSAEGGQAAGTALAADSSIVAVIGTLLFQRGARGRAPALAGRFRHRLAPPTPRRT
jgi:hypothetical protein